jgi:hypothetical protein
MMNPNKRWEEYMFQQYCINKASNGCYLFHFDGTFSRIQWFWTNKWLNDSSEQHDSFNVFSCKLMRYIKFIQHITGIEHITDNLQMKSLEFTSKYIGNFRRKDISLTFDSKPPWAHNWHKQLKRHLLDTHKDSLFKDWTWDSKILTKLENRILVC